MIPAVMIVTLALLVTRQAPVTAQHTQYGVHGGVVYSLHAAQFTQLGDFASCCPSFTGGSGTGFLAGLHAAYRLSDKLFFVPRLTLVQENGSMQSEEWTFVADLRDTPRVRRAMFLHEFTSSVSSVGIEPTFLLGIVGNLSLTGGLRAAWVFDGSFTQRETLVEPDDYGSYLGSARTWVNYQEQIPDLSPFKAEVLGGLHYSLSVGKAQQWHLGTDVSIAIPITNVTSSAEWRTTNIRLAIAVSHGAKVPEADTSIALPLVPNADTVTLPAPPSLSPPEITLKLEGLIQNYRVPFDSVHVEETLIVDYLPVLNHVYFDEGSSTVPERYSTAAHRMVSDARLTPVQATTAILGIVAKRFREKPQTHITVVGSAGPDLALHGIRLAQQRAESVRASLVSLGIPKENIKVQWQADPLTPTRASDPKDFAAAEAENRRVEILVSESSLMRPLELQTVQTVVTPDDIAVSYNISADTTLRASQVFINDSSVHLSTALQHSFTIPSPTEPAELLVVATDVVHNTAKASASIPVSTLTIHRKKTEHRGNLEVERYSLILFGFNDATVTKQHQEILQIIRNKIRNGASVRVIGMTDVMGSEEHNTLLAQRRAAEVAKALSISASEIEATGAQAPQFSNNLPEGRAYNRTVIIEISDKQ